MLINLIRNALKFTPYSGTIELKSTYNRNDGAIVVDVKDTGIGIKQEDLSSLFTMFGKL